MRRLWVLRKGRSAVWLSQFFLLILNNLFYFSQTDYLVSPKITPWLSLVFVPFPIFGAYVKSSTDPDRRVKAAILKDHGILDTEVWLQKPGDH